MLYKSWMLEVKSYDPVETSPKNSCTSLYTRLSVVILLGESYLHMIGILNKVIYIYCVDNFLRNEFEMCAWEEI